MVCEDCCKTSTYKWQQGTKGGKKIGLAQHKLGVKFLEKGKAQDQNEVLHNLKMNTV